MRTSARSVIGDAVTGAEAGRGGRPLHRSEARVEVFGAEEALEGVGDRGLPVARRAVATSSPAPSVARSCERLRGGGDGRLEATARSRRTQAAFGPSAGRSRWRASRGGWPTWTRSARRSRRGADRPVAFAPTSMGRVTTTAGVDVEGDRAPVAGAGAGEAAVQVVAAAGRGSPSRRRTWTAGRTCGPGLRRLGGRYPSLRRFRRHRSALLAPGGWVAGKRRRRGHRSAVVASMVPPRPSWSTQPPSRPSGFRRRAWRRRSSPNIKHKQTRPF